MTQDAPGMTYFLAAGPGDRREFAVILGESGQPHGPVHAFDARRGVAGFRPGETLFALEEPMPLGAGFRTRLLHIAADRDAKPVVTATPGVTYGLFVRKRDDVHSLVCRMDDASRTALEKDGFAAGYPAEFTRGTEGMDPAMLEHRMIDLRVLGRLPLPPHHPQPRAMTARHYAARGFMPLPVRLGGDEWEAPARIFTGFGAAAAPQAPAALKDALLVVVPEMPRNLPAPPGSDPSPDVNLH